MEGLRRVLAALDRGAGWIALAGGWAAALIMVGIVLHVLTEVVMRSFFGRSTQVLEEFVGYGLGAMIFLGLGHALREGALVRVDILLGRLRPAARRATEVFACLVTLAVMWFVMRFFLFGVLRHHANETISMTRAATPLWIPEAVVLLGMAIFTLQVAVYLLRLLAGGPLLPDSQRTD